MRSSPRPFLVFVLTSILAACVGQTPFEWDRAKQVRLGMTETELRMLMGRPSKIQIKGETQMWVWSYTTPSNTTRSVSFELKDGIVTAIPYIE
jgi:outer membrane protein assembly factor BamE (lipoprotein component of BamABCDE complex)